MQLIIYYIVVICIRQTPHIIMGVIWRMKNNIDILRHVIYIYIGTPKRYYPDAVNDSLQIYDIYEGDISLLQCTCGVYYYIYYI